MIADTSDLLSHPVTITVISAVLGMVGWGIRETRASRREMRVRLAEEIAGAQVRAVEQAQQSQRVVDGLAAVELGLSELRRDVQDDIAEVRTGVREAHQRIDALMRDKR